LNFSAIPSVWNEDNTFTLQCGNKKVQSFVLSKDWASYSANILAKPGANKIIFHTSTEANPDSLSDIERYFALSNIAISLSNQ
jgi:hypothetical protein